MISRRHAAAATTPASLMLIPQTRERHRLRRLGRLYGDRRDGCSDLHGRPIVPVGVPAALAGQPPLPA
jgi:hypothetical protein